MGAFDELNLDGTAGLPLYLQVAEGVVKALAEGRLRPGDPVPGTRTLAEKLGVSRNVAVAAFQELLAQGILACEVGSGTRIAATLPSDLAPGSLASAFTGPSYGFDLPSRLEPMEAVGFSRPALDLRGAQLDARLLPGAELARAYRRALERHRPGDGADLKGHSDLRVCLAEHLRDQRGLPTDPERLLLTSGLPESLTLLAVAFLRPGDRVGMEQPGRPKAAQVFELAGGTVVPLPVDERGLVPDALEAVLEAGPLRLLFLSPAAQYPTGVALAPERRARILELATRHRVAVLEEDGNADVFYVEQPPRPLAADDPRGVVIHLGGLGALLGSGLRLGWVRGPRALVDRVAGLRDRAEAMAAWPLEQAVRDLLRDGLVARQGRKVRTACRERRDHLAGLWEQRVGLSVSLPEAGLAFWAPAPRAQAWALRAAEAGVRVEPGGAFHREGVDLPFLHLGFGALEPRELTVAVERLLEARP